MSGTGARPRWARLVVGMLALAGVPGRAEGAPPGAGAAMPSAPSLAPAWGVAVEPPEEPVRQRERRAAAGGAAAELACEPLAEAVLLCLTVQVDGGYRYATQADLASWGLSLGQARAAATARARASLGPGRPEEVAVIDMPRTYRLSAEGDGLDHAAVLAPDLLSAWYGEGVRLAVPGRDVLLAWPAGDEELDRVMAVGVARIHEASDHPVTARVYTWDAAAGAWQVWGQAVR